MGMSTQRAFVIQFLQRPGDEDGFTGRIEHVGSGEAARFTNPDELIAFLARLNGRTARPPESPRADAAAAGAPATGRSRRATRPGAS
jgi:hypothetical protein